MPTAVRFNPPGDVPGPPVQFESDDMGDVKAGYGFESDRTYEGDWFFFHSDHLGSTSYLTDTAGNVSQFVCYTPYGEAIVDEHLNTYENPFKFSGKELDDITGLYDHGARSRNPISTLWYGVDPRYEEFPEMSPFAYCHGNPVRLIDMDGECPALIFPLAEIATDAIIATGLIVYGAVVCERIFDKVKEYLIKRKSHMSIIKKITTILRINLMKLKAEISQILVTKQGPLLKILRIQENLMGKIQQKAKQEGLLIEMQKIKMEFQEVNNQIRP